MQNRRKRRSVISINSAVWLNIYSLFLKRASVPLLLLCLTSTLNKGYCLIVDLLWVALFKEALVSSWMMLSQALWVAVNLVIKQRVKLEGYRKVPGEVIR